MSLTDLPTEHGAVLFLVSGAPLRRLLHPSVLRMSTIFTTLISGWELPNHQAAFIAYASAKKCTLRVAGAVVEAVDSVGGRITGDFDGGGRLVRLTSHP